MPQLPIYHTQTNIQSTPSAPLRSADPLRNEAAQMGADQQTIAKTLGVVSQKMSDANDVMQYTEAKAKHGIAVADIESRAAADPNFRNSETYTKELSAARKTAIDGIANQQVASKAGVEFDYDTQIANIKINAGFKQKQIAYNKVMVKTSLDTLMQNKLAASTPAEAQQYDLKIKDLLTENLQTGTIDYAEADKLLQGSQKTSVQYEIYNDPSTSEKDSTILNQLKDPKGKYAFLDPDTRLDLVQESQRRIFQNNQTFKREVETSQVQRNTDFIDKLATQTATFKDIDNEEKIPEDQGGMKRTVLLQYRRYLENGVDKTLNQWMKEKVDGTSELTRRAFMAKEYNDLIENYLDDKTDQWKAKEQLAKGLADGQLDAEELKVLDPIKQNLKDIKFNKDASPIAWAVKQVKQVMGQSNASSEEIALRTKQLLGNIGAGGDPIAEMGKVMDSEMLKHFPDANTYPKQGKRFIDKKTSRAYRVYNEDGKVKWEWVDGQK